MARQVDIFMNASGNEPMDVDKDFSGGENDQTSQIRLESAQLKPKATKVSEVTIP